MPRRKRLDARDRHIKINKNLDERVNRLLSNPVTEKPKLGAYSQLVERLLREWADEQEGVE